MSRSMNGGAALRTHDMRPRTLCRTRCNHAVPQHRERTLSTLPARSATSANARGGPSAQCWPCSTSSLPHDRAMGGQCSGMCVLWRRRRRAHPVVAISRCDDDHQLFCDADMRQDAHTDGSCRRRCAWRPQQDAGVLELAQQHGLLHPWTDGHVAWSYSHLICSCCCEQEVELEIRSASPGAPGPRHHVLSARHAHGRLPRRPAGFG